MAFKICVFSIHRWNIDKKKRRQNYRTAEETGVCCTASSWSKLIVSIEDELRVDCAIVLMFLAVQSWSCCFVDSGSVTGCSLDDNWRQNVSISCERQAYKARSNGLRLKILPQKVISCKMKFIYYTHETNLESNDNIHTHTHKHQRQQKKMDY